MFKWVFKTKSDITFDIDNCISFLLYAEAQTPGVKLFSDGYAFFIYRLLHLSLYKTLDVEMGFIMFLYAFPEITYLKLNVI